MRGKNILWLSMVFMMLSVMMTINIGKTQTEALIYIDPARIPAAGFAHPEDVYDVAVKVADVTDLRTAAFVIKIARYASVIFVSEVNPGDFLGASPIFLKDIDAFSGRTKIGISSLEGGYSGSGTLLTFKLTVVEAGPSPLDLVEVELYDSVGDPIPFMVQHGQYVGLEANLVRMRLARRPMSVSGSTQTFYSKVENYGDLPLQVKVMFSNVREDGAKFTFGDGQAFTTAPPRETEYLYVDGFVEQYRDWTEIGAMPWLDAPDDGNMIEGTVDEAQHRWFTFEDVDLSDGALIGNVVLEGYTNGPYNEDVDYDIYGLVGSTGDFGWLGSLYGTGDWTWQTVRWTTDTASDILPAIKTGAGLNSLMALAYFYDPGGYGGAGNFLDALRLRVEFAPPIFPLEPVVYTVQPGETLELGPATWTLRSPDVGRYAVTATAYYSFYGDTWHAGEKVKTKSWWVTP